LRTLRQALVKIGSVARNQEVGSSTPPGMPPHSFSFTYVLSVEADPVWRIVAAASVAAIDGTLPPGAQPSVQRQSDFGSFAAGGNGEYRNCAVSGTDGRSAEVLREGSGI